MNLEEKIIHEYLNKKTYKCSNCSSFIQTHSLLNGQKIYFFLGNSSIISENILTISDQQVVTPEGTFNIEQLFKECYVSWGCPKCNVIMINYVYNCEPYFIIPMENSYNLQDYLLKIIEEDIKRLITEFYQLKSLNLYSSAILIGRKILMHLCVSLDICEEQKTFTDYVDELDASGLLGKKWKSKIDKIRVLGNQENHQIKLATSSEVQEIEEIIKGIIINIYS